MVQYKDRECRTGAWFNIRIENVEQDFLGLVSFLLIMKTPGPLLGVEGGLGPCSPRKILKLRSDCLSGGFTSCRHLRPSSGREHYFTVV